jgi:hypothetical protein
MQILVSLAPAGCRRQAEASDGWGKTAGTLLIIVGRDYACADSGLDRIHSACFPLEGLAPSQVRASEVAAADSESYP